MKAVPKNTVGGPRTVDKVTSRERSRGTTVAGSSSSVIGNTDSEVPSLLVKKVPCWEASTDSQGEVIASLAGGRSRGLGTKTDLINSIPSLLVRLISGSSGKGLPLQKATRLRG